MRQYDRKNLVHARTMRRDPTPAERDFWRALRARKLKLKWRRQQPFDHYILDFYCAELRLALELDGDSHLGKESYDEERIAHLESQGVFVLRLTNSALKGNHEGVMEAIFDAAESQRVRLGLPPLPVR